MDESIKVTVNDEEVNTHTKYKHTITYCPRLLYSLKLEEPGMQPPLVYRVSNDKLLSENIVKCSTVNGTNTQVIYIHVLRKSKFYNSFIQV